MPAPCRCSADAGEPPSTPGWSARMLQTGALIRDLSVRELVAMMASLYPRPARRRRGARADRPRRASPAGARRSSRAARRSGSASRSRSSATPSCSCSTSRRSRMDVEGRREFWTAMRELRGAAARRCCSRRTTSRRPTRTPTASILMARGRIVADGPPTEIKALRRRADDPGDAARTSTGRRLGTLPGVAACRAARRRGRAHLLRLRRRASARCSTAYPDARDIEITGAGLEQAFLQLTGEPRTPSRPPRRPRERRRLHPLRAPAHVPQPAVLHLLARLPARPLLR